MSNETLLNTTQQSPVTVGLDELLAYRRLAHSLRLARRRRVSSKRTGEMQSRVLGRGLDFTELREYQAGDDIRQIDWNVTARTGRPHTKLFSIEQERPCFVVVDLRSGMHFATREAYKSVVAARLSAILAWSAVMSHDRVGGLVFSGSRHVEIKPESGRRGLMRLFRAIIAAWDTTAAAGKEDVFTDAVTRLSRLAHTGSTIWFCSDFSGFDDRVKTAFSGVMRHNEVNAIHIADVLESQLPPPGEYPVRSLSGDIRLNTRLSDSRKQYYLQFKQHQDTLRQCFSRGRHYFTSLYTHDPLDEKAMAILRHLPPMQVEP